MDLKAIYLTTLERCAPEKLVRPLVTSDMPRNVVAIGKCAGALFDGVAAVHDIESAFVAVPDRYKLPDGGAAAALGRRYSRESGGRSGRRSTTHVEIHIGGHPQMTRASFDAGRALLEFVDAHRDILFLVSGGGSACVEVAIAGHSEDELIERNAGLIASGMDISAINAKRRKLSAIKGGKLGERVRGEAVTLIYSDVSRGKLEDVASGPSLKNMILIADNDTLTSTAAELMDAKRLPDQIECDVQEAATLLAREKGIVAGGEPTVKITGPGRGGRCTELAVRFAMRSTAEALFASSDGVDGNSGVAGIYLPHRDNIGGGPEWEAALAASDSMRIATQIGEPIMITPSGNNLRDLFLVARD